MIPISKDMQNKIFTTQQFYIEALEDILDCLVKKEDYEKAAEVRDLIIYESIQDCETKKLYFDELVNKYVKT
jgi:protein-arginine kinase activator protein McsA